MIELKSVAFRAKAFTKKIVSSVSVEPLMLLDGLAFSNMHVYIENLHMDRLCHVNAGYSEEVCHNLKVNPRASIEVQQKYSVFALYNGIIAAALPLFFILFMGAWSDKYGRKVPLIAVEVGHLLHAGGYLLASLEPHWPVEFFLLVTLLDTLGGGAVSFLMVANSYVSDISSEKSRTSRVGLANSIWFLGGPMGTLLGTYIFKKGGYLLLFTTSLTLSMAAVIYVIVFLPESHGPFAKKLKHGSHLPFAKKLDHRSHGPFPKKLDRVAQGPLVKDLDPESFPLKKKVTTSNSDKEMEPLDLRLTSDTPSPEKVSLRIMVKDFFSPRRILDSFTSILKKREGNARAMIHMLIFTSLLRRLSRSPYVFAFTRHELGWKAADYSLWVTYKNVLATAGSLAAVPVLSGYFGICDNVLAMVGSLSSVVEYVVYGCVSDAQPELIWIAPVAALLLNSCSIAQRSMMTKIITKDEIGKVSAVLGALDGMMPMVSSALYTAVYHSSVRVFPAAHFFVGASVSGLVVIMFLIIIIQNKTGMQSTIQKQNLEEGVDLIDKKIPVSITDSGKLTGEAYPSKRTLDGGFSGLTNFGLYQKVPVQDQDIQSDNLTSRVLDVKIPAIKDKSLQDAGMDSNNSAASIPIPSDHRAEKKTFPKDSSIKISISDDFQQDHESTLSATGITTLMQDKSKLEVETISRTSETNANLWTRKLRQSFKRFLVSFQRKRHISLNNAKNVADHDEISSHSLVKNARSITKIVLMSQEKGKQKCSDVKVAR